MVVSWYYCDVTLFRSEILFGCLGALMQTIGYTVRERHIVTRGTNTDYRCQAGTV